MQARTHSRSPVNPLRNVSRMLSFLVVLALTASACTSEGNGGGSADSIVISGSSTVEPISIAVAEKFADTRPDVDVSVDGPGTGDGFEAFCNGEADISDASRSIAPQEIEACESNGIEFIEMKVAIDGIAVLTSPDNDAVAECLSFSDLYSLVGPESQGFDQWSDANSLVDELGNSQAAPFPDVALDITGPGEESGTYDSFVEIVLEDIAEERGQDAQTRPDYQASADDNIIVQGVTGTGTSFGWVGYAFLETNRGQLKPFEIAGGDGNCVAATAETIADGSYPIARPLFIYANAQRVEENDALAEFLELYLSDEGLASASEVGYVALGSDEVQATRQAWESRETGTRES